MCENFTEEKQEERRNAKTEIGSNDFCIAVDDAVMLPKWHWPADQPINQPVNWRGEMQQVKELSTWQRDQMQLVNLTIELETQLGWQLFGIWLGFVCA